MFKFNQVVDAKKQGQLFKLYFNKKNYTTIELTMQESISQLDWIGIDLQNPNKQDVFELGKNCILFDFLKINYTDSNGIKYIFYAEFEDITRFNVCLECNSNIYGLGYVDLAKGIRTDLFFGKYKRIYFDTTVDQIFGTCMYILLYDPTLEELPEIENKHTTKKSAQKQDSVIYLHKRFRFKKGEQPTHKSHEIKCECWEVRGHFRCYKSGKVIFINPYKKGKNKESEPKKRKYVI